MSRLEELVTKTNETIFTAEFPVIDGEGMAKVEKYAKRLAPWFDGVNATDNTAAHAHASNVASAIAMKMHGLDPIMQVVCRDKNRLAQQADVVGATLHGVENFVALTGDDVTAGDETETRRVFDLDGPQLIRLMTSIKNGQYLSGRKIEPAPKMFIGAVENPSAPPFEYRAQRVAKKVAAGAKFFQLQICYHKNRLEKFMETLNTLGLTKSVAIIPTIVLISGPRALNFMNASVPGIDVPEDVIKEVETASDKKEAAYLQTLDFAKHALSLPGVRGLHVTDFRHDETLERLMSDLGRKARPENTTREENAYTSTVS
ncbi:MAG: methylenetetrahydrofolate reductase [Candidatus Nanopelagicales bacterium]